MLLDTDFIIDLLGGLAAARQLAEGLDSTGEVLRIPSPSVFELSVGAEGALTTSKESQRLEALLLAYETVPFDLSDARRAGALQAALRKEGKSAGTVDVQIAGMCLARDEALVTGDRALARIGRGLKVRTYSRI